MGEEAPMNDKNLVVDEMSQRQKAKRLREKFHTLLAHFIEHFTMKTETLIHSIALVITLAR